jgi:hypothetical protein
MAANVTANVAGAYGQAPSYEMLTNNYYAAAAVTAGTVVQLVTATVDGQTIAAVEPASGPAANLIGIAQNSVSLGGIVTVVVQGVTTATAGVAITAGENLSANTGAATLGAASTTIGDNIAFALQAIASGASGLVCVARS